MKPHYPWICKHCDAQQNTTENSGHYNETGGEKKHAEFWVGVSPYMKSKNGLKLYFIFFALLYLNYYSNLCTLRPHKSIIFWKLLQGYVLWSNKSLSQLFESVWPQLSWGVLSWLHVKLWHFRVICKTAPLSEVNLHLYLFLRKQYAIFVRANKFR